MIVQRLTQLVPIPIWSEKDIAIGPEIVRTLTVTNFGFVDPTDVYSTLTLEQQTRVLRAVDDVRYRELDSFVLNVLDAGEPTERQFEWASFSTMRTPP